MRDLIISIVAVALLIGTWLVFFDYSSDNIDSYTYTIKKEILPAVEAEQWEESKQLIKSLNKDWHKYKKVALLFLDTQTVNEIDYTLARSIKYVKAEDVSNSSGELNAMIEQLKFLKKNDEVSAANIL
ncbi:MAG: DUF4363 family protein [Firmicutes bacterium]|nr:DUF4363 family protein [Bacillota bacterium]